MEDGGWRRRIAEGVNGRPPCTVCAYTVLGWEDFRCGRADIFCARRIDEEGVEVSSLHLFISLTLSSLHLFISLTLFISSSLQLSAERRRGVITAPPGGEALGRSARSRRVDRRDKPGRQADSIAQREQQQGALRGPAVALEGAQPEVIRAI